MTGFPRIRRLSRVEASNYLYENHGITLKPSTLAKLAVIGGGPEFRKDGRFAIYEPLVLDQYAYERLSKPVRSTAELRLAR